VTANVETEEESGSRTGLIVATVLLLVVMCGSFGYMMYREYRERTRKIATLMTSRSTGFVNVDVNDAVVSGEEKDDEQEEQEEQEEM
jgi:hypothetical protein